MAVLPYDSGFESGTSFEDGRQSRRAKWDEWQRQMEAVADPDVLRNASVPALTKYDNLPQVGHSSWTAPGTWYGSYGIGPEFNAATRQAQPEMHSRNNLSFLNDAFAHGQGMVNDAFTQWQKMQQMMQAGIAPLMTPPNKGGF